MERKEAIEVIKKNYPHVAESGSQFETALRMLIPELKESKDERIRKEIINYFECQSRDEPTRKDIHNKWIAWLEKQGKISDKIVERARTEKQRILVTESDGVANIDWDTRSLQDVKLLLKYGLDYIKKLEKQGEQKLINKVEPKFKVGDIIKYNGTEYKITEITPNGYKVYALTYDEDAASLISFSAPAILVELKPAWSEEDEEMYKKVETAIDSYYAPFSRDAEEMQEWFKSLKGRV